MMFSHFLILSLSCLHSFAFTALSYPTPLSDGVTPSLVLDGVNYFVLPGRDGEFPVPESHGPPPSVPVPHRSPPPPPVPLTHAPPPPVPEPHGPSPPVPVPHGPPPPVPFPDAPPPPVPESRAPPPPIPVPHGPPPPIPEPVGPPPPDASLAVATAHSLLSMLNFLAFSFLFCFY